MQKWFHARERTSMNNYAWILSILCLPTVLLAGENKAWDYPWDMELRGRQDQPVIDKLGKGWFMNLGPTGVRAKITHDLPSYFTVMFVFADSPAAGKINAGDIVVGANGKIMDVPHKFGGGCSIGNEGPLTEMAKLIEDAQGKDGKLDFIVWAGGDRNKPKVVTVQIEPVGRFSATYPFNCKRSDQLHQKLCNYLADEYKLNDRWLYLVHSNSTCELAMMTSNNPEHQALIKKIGAKLAKVEKDGEGNDSWALGYRGIVLGEYYLLTHDQNVIPHIQSIEKALSDGISWASGSYSHYVFPSIMERVHQNGGWGYGPMSNPGGLAMIALSLFKDAGLPYPTETYQRLHQSYLNSVNKYGAIDYGFTGWECAILKLKNPDLPESKSTNGIGFICPQGMKGMGEFTVIPPPGDGAKPGDDNKDKSWLVSEAAKVKVYDMGGDLRMAVRDMTKPEPTKPYPVLDHNSGCHARMGLGTLAHSIGNSDNVSFKYLADHMANACANGYDGLYDGHACGMMHALWGTLGAAKADPVKFRKYMDHIKWWFIMAETHNGGFVVMPNRDYASMDVYSSNRHLVSATAALILSLKDHRLRITGASSSPTANSKATPATRSAEFGPAQKTDSSSSATGKSAAAVTPLPPLAKKEEPAKPIAAEVTVAPEVLVLWHERLVKKLDAIGKAGRKIAMDFGDGREYLLRGATPQTLLVKVQGNDLPMPWRMLSLKICASLAKDAATDDDAESLIIAAIYQMAIGSKEQADTLFAKAAIKDAAATSQARESIEKRAPQPK